jgi:hypothetical protein
MRLVVRLAIGICLAASLSTHGSAQARVAPQAATPADPPPASHINASPKSLPGTHVEAFAIVHGKALDSSDDSLAHSLVRLRDARTGHVLDTQVTDKNGLFSFFKVDPGFYLVELFDKSQQTLAASPLVTAQAGVTSNTTVKLPTNHSLLSGLFMLNPQGPGSIPALGLIPVAVLQSIPAIVPAGDPASER